MTDTPVHLLTTSQEHYLKKYLLGILIKKELGLLLSDPHQTLPNLGGPFDLKDEHADSTTPFLRYLFESLVIPFPFFSSTKESELWSKLEQFMGEWAKLEAGNGVEQEEMTRRKRIRIRSEKSMVLLYSMSVKTTKQRAQEKLEEQRKNEKGIEDSLEGLKLGHDVSDIPTTGPSVIINGYRINVAGIRIIKEKRHIREHEIALYILLTTSPEGREFIVARRFSQFKRLYISLREEHPQYEFPLPPTMLSSKSKTKAMREMNRIRLRGYLHNLAKVAPEVVSSSVFVGFLTKDPVALNEEETKDIKARATLDEHRMQQQAKFDIEVAKKTEEVDKHLKQVKSDLLQPGGVSRLFVAFKENDKVENLPVLYQATFEWGCMKFAASLYHAFTASDEATINVAQLKRTHLLMPYRAMWGILKVSNPMAMMKGIVDLFLAQPFGRRSLMQRIISVNIQEHISEYKNNVVQLEALINDPGLCEKIRNYVYTPKAVIDKIFPDNSLYSITDMTSVMKVLKSDHIQPLLQLAQIDRVWDAQQKLEKEDAVRLEERMFSSSGGDSSDLEDESDGSDKESSSFDEANRHATKGTRSKSKSFQGNNLVKLIQQLLVTQLRIRDKERIMELVFQGVTGEILKEIISIFYQPLVKVYKAANVADSMMDVKEFIDELIKVVEQADVTEDGKSGKPPISTLYLNLVKKHLPNFYRFVHSVHKQDDGLFHDLLEWIESVLIFLRTGYARRRINYKTGEELRATIDLDEFVKAFIGQNQWGDLQLEAKSLEEYFTLVKERKREKIRHIAGLDHASQSDQTNSLLRDTQDRDRERVSKELRGLGMRQEDVDELEMINYHSCDTDEDETDEENQESTLKVPQVPIVDTLRVPFVNLMDKALFISARE
ncbi:hypothetical protein BGZ76_006645 [Entomortierella beljakovae]|nr:hypothetical protein BGZ76_006645 [Entomortierella beljakovae]